MATISNADKNENQSPISPPTPSSFALNNYSLFDWPCSSATDWLSINSNANTNPILRKHSVQVDGHDFPGNVTAPTDYWRRSSIPNIMSTCALCFDAPSQLYNLSCGQHQFCHTCLNNNTQSMIQGTCPFCAQRNFNAASRASPPSAPTNATAYSSNDYLFNTTYSQASNTAYYPCVKLTNIPWDVSQNDVRHFFGNCRIPPSSTCSQSIHIMMDRTTGKTLSDAYVEFATVFDLRRAIETKNQKPLKGRIVSVTECCQEELLKVVFPKWRGQFQGISAIPPPNEVLRTMTTAAGGGSSSGCPPFITREEINSLLVVCKNYKLHFSRKCAERPFENIISVIAKYPWHQFHLISTMHRDHIYEMLKLAIESLKTHLAKDYVQIDSTLLERLVRAGIMCPAFTERQKTTLLQASRMECPQDIVGFLVSNSAPIGTAVGVAATGSIMPAPPGFITAHAASQSSQKQQFAVHPWKVMSDEDDLLFTSADISPISSIIQDIQKSCTLDDATSRSKQSPSPSHPLSNNGIPLLLQPIPNQLEQSQRSSNSIKNLSPWAPAFKSKSPSDIWRMTLPVESSKSLLTA
ncbi:uncharacterized protein ATC70_007117 [Mucor velutinosus]|uniref:Uncharacterized protein n=1 Tax=Mucor velutinosus TaxID=708070 RepID=A0AAN7HVY5_9FUNG|nr:hypothetical protein ATC70_007117 [Mucor velutinosus]